MKRILMEPSNIANVQNFAAVQSLIAVYSFISSPPIIVGVVWWLVKRYFGKQEELIKGLTTSMDDVKLKIALYDSKSKALDDALTNVSKMRDDITILKSKLDAAFRIIDHLTSFEKDVENRLKPTPKPQ
jgi:predicted nucleic-acid-binding protein